MTTAEQQLSKVRQLAEKRARLQNRADAYLSDLKAAGENYRFWLEKVRECDAQMKQLAEHSEP